MVVANGTFDTATVIASGVGNVYVIGVESHVDVNLAGTASLSIGADSSECPNSSSHQQAMLTFCILCECSKQISYRL